MKESRRLVARFSLVLLLACCLPVLQAQDEDTGQTSEPFYKKFSIGGRGTVLFFNLMKVQEYTNSIEDPPLTIHEYSRSGSKRFGGGVSLGFDFSNKFALNIDALWKRAGYDSGKIHKLLIDAGDPDNENDDRYATTGRFERTRADYWDIPVLLRVYTIPQFEGDRRFFLTGGAAARFVTGIKSYHEFKHDDGLSDTNTNPIRPANRVVPGVVIGGGVQFQDDVGLKVDLEVRYTRWLQKTFDAGPVQSNLNQGEFLLGLTF